MAKAATSKSKKTSRTSPKRPAARATRGRRPRAGAPRADKAEGDAPVRQYIARLDGWKREVAQRFDALVGREVPSVRRAVKWGNPFYGVEGQGWFAAFAAFKKHVKITFFRGTSLSPVPPSGEHKDGRSLDLTEAESFDERLIGDWVRQASRLPGWGA